MNNRLITGDLERLGLGRVAARVPLHSISRWKIGGIADVMVAPRNTEELAKLRAWIKERGLQSVVIGSTTNLLFSDEGLRAIVIHITKDFAPLQIHGCRIVAGPGLWVPTLARRAMNYGLTGIEHTCGIPGTLGGLVCMNGGSQRKGIGDTVIAVQSVSENGEITERKREDCGFEYRTSIFQHNGEVVSQVRLELQPTDKPSECRKAMLGILRDRRSKFPQKLPNCGSVFVSNPEMYKDYGPPGKIIEMTGFKGYQIGGAMVSTQHANFIVNIGYATAKDVLELIAEIKRVVAVKTGYVMDVEVRFVTPDGKVVSL